MNNGNQDYFDKAAIVRGDPELSGKYSEGTLEGALHILSRQARLMIGAHQSALSFLPQGNFELGIHTHSFSPKWAKYNSYDVMPTGNGIWSIILEQKRPIRLTQEKLLAHPKWKNFSDMKNDRGLEHPELRGWLATPIINESNGHILGVIQLSDKYEGDFTQQDENTLAQLASIIAPTFEVSGICNINDDLSNLQIALIHSEKLAALGQVASGIVHEINTPIQFVGDNVRACNDMFEDLKRLISEYHGFLDHVEKQEAFTEEATRIRAIEEEMEVDYIFREIPVASSQCLDGIERVQTIVKAMKDFSHGGTSNSKSTFDVNAGLDNTLTVAHNELKYSSNLKTDFANIPKIRGYPGELNQVFLNLLVNAAHAIKNNKNFNEKGTISIRTRLDLDCVVVSIGDTGCGIPESIRNKIFDPFFTTKESGEGTGQGLAISHNIVVNRHGGHIEVESEEGVGTTFHIFLPITGDLKTESKILSQR